MIKVQSNIALPQAIRVSELEDNQVALQVERDNVWMRIGKRLFFTPRIGTEGWNEAPVINTRVYVNPFPKGTMLTFHSCK